MPQLELIKTYILYMYKIYTILQCTYCNYFQKYILYKLGVQF